MPLPDYIDNSQHKLEIVLKTLIKEAVVKKILSEEQYFLTSVGGIFAVIFVLLVIAIVRLKFYL